MMVLLKLYTLRRAAPPQYSERFPLQSLLQPLRPSAVVGAIVPPFVKLLPHQHSPPYSQPASLKPAAWQAVVQLATVRFAAPPGTWTPAWRRRPVVPSLILS